MAQPLSPAIGVPSAINPAVNPGTYPDSAPRKLNMLHMSIAIEDAEFLMEEMLRQVTDRPDKTKPAWFGEGGDFRVFAIKACEPQVALRMAKNHKLPEAKLQQSKNQELYRQLKHENLVPMLCSFSGRAEGLIEVMPLYEGDVRDYISSHTYTPNEVCRWMQPVCCALEYMRDEGISHEDIKPENILFRHCDGQMQLAITDLGWAGVIGTPFFCDTSNCAPEVSKFWRCAIGSDFDTLAGVDYRVDYKRHSSHDVWSVAFTTLFIISPFDRLICKPDVSDFLRQPALSPSYCRPQDIQFRPRDIVESRIMQTKAIKRIHDEMIPGCLVQDTVMGKDQLLNVLKVAQKGMSVNNQLRPSIEAFADMLKDCIKSTDSQVVG